MDRSLTPKILASPVGIADKGLPAWCLPVGVLGLAAILFCARFGNRALWSEELRWVEIPREMLLTGDFFWPTINGKSYYDKPLGSYWLVLVAADVTGAVDESSARLPCALAGLIGVALLMALGWRLFGLKSAAFAGFILSTSFSYVFFARNASADMENLAGVLAALALLLWHEHKSSGGWWVIGLWLIMAVTSLTKGLLGFALPLLIFGIDSCLKDGWRAFATQIGRGPIRERMRCQFGRSSWLFNRWSIIAIPLGLAVFLAPFVLSSHNNASERGLGLLYRENVQRFFNPHNHRGPIYLYVYVIFGLMAPWSLFLPAALVQAHQSCRKDSPGRRGDRFALAFFWGTFAFFTLAASRRSYYLLPILPAAALLVSRLLTAPRDSISPSVRWLLRLGFAVLVMGVGAVGLAFLPGSWINLEFPQPPELPILAGLWFACLAAIGVALWDFRPSRMGLAAGAVAVATSVYLFLAALPAAESFRDGKAFAQRVKSQLAGDMEHLVLFRTRDPVFYLGQPKPIPEFDDGESLRAAAAGKVRWVIVRQKDMHEMRKNNVVVDREASYDWEGPDRKLDKLLLIRLKD